MTIHTHPELGSPKRSESTSAGPGMRTMLAILGVLLLQTLVVAGVNTSGADPLAVAVLCVLLLRNTTIPAIPTVIAMLILTTTLATAAFITPHLFGVAVSPALLVRDAAKLLMSYIYFILGYALIRSGWMDTVIRWYSRAGLLVAAVGATWAFLGLGAMRDTLFYGDVRFRGISSDPNMCAILLVASLPYFARSNGKAPLTIIAYLTVLAGVLATGSKTGFVVYGLYAAVTCARGMGSAWRRPKAALVVLLLTGVATSLLLLAALGFVGGLTAHSVEGNFGASRATEVLANPAQALTESGSGRLEAFSTAVSIIAASPLAGVGIGTYSDVASALSGSPVIAHNTYLQLAAEWGLPLAVGFVVLTLLLVTAALTPSTDHAPETPILADMCLILLAGGLAVSLNNVRLFWLSLGGVAAASRGAPPHSNRRVRTRPMS